MPQLFEPMLKRNMAASAPTNMGLWFFTCKEIVNAHGGTISATSGSEGTVCRVAMPSKDRCPA